MMKFTVFLFLFELFLLSSCRKIRDDLLPDSHPKIYCQSLLCPDSLVKVFVGKSGSILDPKTHFINTAHVLLFEGNALVDSLLLYDSGCYLSSVKPMTNTYYTLKVIADSVLMASTTVPEAIAPTNVQFEFPTGYDAPNQQYFGNLTFTISDNPMSNDYYELIIYYKNFYAPQNEYYYQYISNPSYILVPDVVVDNEGDWSYFPTSVFFSDDLFNGKQQQFSFSVVSNMVKLPDGTTTNTLANNGYLMLRSISPEYYYYRKYYTRHAYNSGIHDDGIRNLLFTGEPLDMYTNVSGGLGVVASFSNTETKIKEQR